MKTAIVCCVHGNEKYGLEVARRMKRRVAYFIANKEAAKRNVRFIDADLNRSFPGNPYGNHEERIAFELAAKLAEFDYVVDLHSSSNSCPLFGIITKPDNISLAMKLGLERLVVMPRSFAKGKALIDHAKSGISLEIGPHKGKDNAELVERALINLLDNKGPAPKINVYEVFGSVKKTSENVFIKNFQDVKQGQLVAEGQTAEHDFVAVLVNEEAYPGILCLACRKLKG